VDESKFSSSAASATTSVMAEKLAHLRQSARLFGGWADDVRGAVRPLDEHLLEEALGVGGKLVVVPLRDVAKLGETSDAKLTASVSEELERHLELPRHRQVVDQLRVVGSRRVGERPRGGNGGSGQLPDGA